MVPERSMSVNLDGGAPDGIAVAIDVKRAVGGADDDRDGPFELRSGFQSYSLCVSGRSISGGISFGASIRPGFDARCGTGVLPSPTTTVPPFDVSLKSNCEKSKGRLMQPWLAG